MAEYLPPGWPTGVHPPGSEEFERSAVAWLLDVVPSDYLMHGVLRRHPIALAAMARHYLEGCVEGARGGYRTVRTELGPHLPPAAIEAVLAVYRSEGTRLAAAAQAAGLIERALHGERFTPRLAAAGRQRRQATGPAQPPVRTAAQPDRQARPDGQVQPPPAEPDRPRPARQRQAPGRATPARDRRPSRTS